MKRSIIIAIGCGLFLIGCGKATPPAPATQPAPAPGPAQTKPAEHDNRDANLYVPPGALKEAVEITISTMKEPFVDSNDGMRQVSQVFRLNHVSFTIPATLTLPFDRDADPARIGIFEFAPFSGMDDQPWGSEKIDGLSIDSDKSTISAKIEYGAIYAVFEKTPIQDAAPKPAPVSPTALTDTLIDALKKRLNFSDGFMKEFPDIYFRLIDMPDAAKWNLFVTITGPKYQDYAAKVTSQDMAYIIGEIIGDGTSGIDYQKSLALQQICSGSYIQIVGQDGTKFPPPQQWPNAIPESAPYLRKLLKNNDDTIRTSAIEALCLMDDKASADEFLTLMKSRRLMHWDRDDIIKALVKWGFKAFQGSPDENARLEADLKKQGLSDKEINRLK